MQFLWIEAKHPSEHLLLVGEGIKRMPVTKGKTMWKVELEGERD